jgi:hypothetical protein
VTFTPRPEELDLARLRFKYETILALRLRAQGAEPPVTELRALSHEFPGALRSLDTLTLAHVHDRIDQIVSAELDPGQVAKWMVAELTFAHAMRGVKVVKAWLRGRKVIDAELHELFMREVPRLRDSALALTWNDQLATIARPPLGRLVPLAIARVAVLLGTSEEEAAALVFRDQGHAAGPFDRELPDQDLLGVEDVPPPELPELPPVAAGAAPDVLPPPPSDFLLELSPLGVAEDESDDGALVAGGEEPDGLEDE